jgi:hypothetical protein
LRASGITRFDHRAARVTYQQPRPSLCLSTALLVSHATMTAARLAHAMTRIEAALARIEAARETLASAGAKGPGSAKVVELVNAHEKLREQVAESLRELDDVLANLEDER